MVKVSIFMYVEINVIAVIIAIVVLIMSKVMAQSSQKYFNTAMIMLIVFSLSDTIWMMTYVKVIPLVMPFALFLKSVYFISTSIMCYYFFFFFFVYEKKSISKAEVNTIHWLSFIITIQIVMTIINVKTGWFFYYEYDGGEYIYTRGKLFMLQYIIAYGFVLMAIFCSLGRSFKHEFIKERETLISSAVFPVLPAIGGIIQFHNRLLPVVAVAISLSSLFMLIAMQNTLVARDFLTGISNRKQLFYMMNKMMKGDQDKSELYLLMMDVNLFKKINDTFGHIEGDNALIRVSDSLKKACAGLKHRAVIGRYGGDEFIIIADLKDDISIDLLCDKIHTAIHASNENVHSRYNMSISIGVYKYENSLSTSREFINKADEDLYKVKKKWKSEVGSIFK